MQLRQAPTLVAPNHQVIPNPLTFPELAHNLGYNSVDRVTAFVEAWRGLIQDARPTGVITDFGIGAVIAAQSLRIPVLQFGTGFECPPLDDPIARLRLARASEGSSAIETYKMLVSNVAIALSRCCDDRYFPTQNDLLKPDRQILATLPDFDAYPRMIDSNEYVGIWDRPIGDAFNGGTVRWKSQ